MRTTFLRRLALGAAALLPLLAAGCINNAAWLPDSSGFVYTGGGYNMDTLYLYDLDKKTSRVLVEKGAGAAWPAVSPDGERVAVARRSEDADSAFLEVVVCNRAGKEVQRSARMKWSDRSKAGVLFGARAFWVPGQDKILLDTDGAAGLYDLKTNSSTPLDVTLCRYRNTPIRPDGKGFLAVSLGDNPKLVFVDWDGKKHEIDAKSIETIKNPNEDVVKVMILYPMMHSSHWDGDTAVVSWDDLKVAIDADKFTAALEQIKPAMSADGKVIQDEVKLAGGAVVRVVELIPRYKDGDLNNEMKYRLEVVKRGTKEPKTLMDEDNLFLINPSPDGKKAVVRATAAMKLFVIGADGDLADTIDLK